MGKISLSDFSNRVEIGHGAFGTVYRAIFTKTKKCFALKQMSKSQLQKKNMVTQINTEIKIMKEMKEFKCEYIIKFYDCFEDQNNIYLVLELAENGQLFDLLRRKGRFSQEEVKAMIKDVIAGVQFLHSQNPPIIHRDIKPENLLLDRNNRIKLADFGWSNFSNKPRKTYCGTVDYLAPEMINQSGHDQRLDIWCIGVLVYQLLTGRTPFLGDNKINTPNKDLIYQNILNMRIQFPADFPTTAKDFVMGMIKRVPKQRMTFQQIKNHPWLTSDKQELLEKKRIQPIKTGTTSIMANVVKVQQSNSQIQNNNNGHSKQIIKQLNSRTKQLEEELLVYKMREKQNMNSNSTAISMNVNQEVNRLNSEIRRLKVVQEVNEKYKKQQENLWETINKKQKQLINIRIQMKKMQDEADDFKQIKLQKQKLMEKTKRLQKQIKGYQQKNRDLEGKLDQANSGIEQRVKNGEKIMLAEMGNPQFLSYLQDQILELTQKFETSKTVFIQMTEKQRKNQQKQQQLARLKIQEKKMKQIVRSQLREIYQNQKDDILQKARKQLEEERQKSLKQRQQLKASYQENGTSSTQASIFGNGKEDLEGELRNIKDLNKSYQKMIDKQKSEIEDLKQQLKRKK